MIFDTFDNEFLKLCGLCRYMPKGLHRRYDSGVLKKSIVMNLQVHGLVKEQSNHLSYKLTKTGRNYLAEIGYVFLDDVRMDLTRPSYKRKLKNAEWNMLLYLAGIDVYLSLSEKLSGKEVGYVSSLMMRCDRCKCQDKNEHFLSNKNVQLTITILHHIDFGSVPLTV